MTRTEYLTSLLESAPCEVEMTSHLAAKNLRWELYAARRLRPDLKSLIIRVKGSTLTIAQPVSQIISVNLIEGARK